MGPDRTGVAAAAAGLPRSWPAGGPQVLWKVAVGRGFAGAAIFRDSVLLLDREDDARDLLRRFRLTNGTEVWRKEFDAPGKLDYNGSRTTPSTDGELIWTIGPFGHIRVVHFADGSPAWTAHLLDDWEAKGPQWGVSQPPLLLHDAVVVAPWGKKAAIVAYRKTEEN